MFSVYFDTIHFVVKNVCWFKLFIHTYHITKAQIHKIYFKCTESRCLCTKGNTISLHEYSLIQCTTVIHLLAPTDDIRHNWVKV